MQKRVVYPSVPNSSVSEQSDCMDLMTVYANEPFCVGCTLISENKSDTLRFLIVLKGTDLTASGFGRVCRVISKS